MSATVSSLTPLGTSVPGNVLQIDALRNAKIFLRDLLRGEENMEPAKLYTQICKALGEYGTDNQLLAQDDLVQCAAARRGVQQ